MFVIYTNKFEINNLVASLQYTLNLGHPKQATVCYPIWSQREGITTLPYQN